MHQSAKDYLLDEASDELLPSGIAHQHHMVFSRSLELLSEALKGDIYGLQATGYLIDEVSTPQPDPLAPIQYSCIFWIDHLRDSAAHESLDESDAILAFFEGRYLQWLEALSLLNSIPAGVQAIEKLEVYLVRGFHREWGFKKTVSNILQQVSASQYLQDIIKDARRFLLAHKGIIEYAPLQVYTSALIFSPIHSQIRRLFGAEEPSWISLKPKVEANWTACLQTLEVHDSGVLSVSFSNNGQRLASGSNDNTVKIWDATSGVCLHILQGHDNWVTSVVFSNNGQWLASGSDDKTVKIWDVTSGVCLQTVPVDRPVFSFAFDPLNDSRLFTNIGDLKLDMHTPKAILSAVQALSRTSSFGDYTMSENGTWIMKGKETMLWLSPKYRPMCSGGSGSKVALGCRSGRVLIIGFTDAVEEN